MTDKLIHNLRKELKQIGEQPLNPTNLEMASKLAETLKELKEVEKMEGGMTMRNYIDYRDSYNYSNYGRDYRDGYGRQGSYNTGTQYRGNDPRMKDKLERIMEGVDMYEYGRDRYMHGDNESRMHEGLEKLMYALCMFIESTMDFAESPDEKEIIRKHIQKLQKM